MQRVLTFTFSRAPRKLFPNIVNAAVPRRAKPWVAARRGTKTISIDPKLLHGKWMASTAHTRTDCMGQTRGKYCHRAICKTQGLSVHRAYLSNDVVRGSTGEGVCDDAQTPDSVAKKEQSDDLDCEGVLDEELACPGCGVVLQCMWPERAGYVNERKLYEPLESTVEEEVNIVRNTGLFRPTLCQRCYRLRHYNQDTEIDDIRAAHTSLSFLQQYDAAIVHVIDLLDLGGSLIPNLPDLVGKTNPVLIAVNKADLLLDSVPDKPYLVQRTAKLLKAELSRLGWTNVEGIVLVSAVTGVGVLELQQHMQRLRGSRDVFFVGCANVGKSSLLNALLRLSRGQQIRKDKNGGSYDDLTVSSRPGTTVGILSFPLEDTVVMKTGQWQYSPMMRQGSAHRSGRRRGYVHDTPGLTEEQQISQWLTQRELKALLPAKPLVPRTFALNPGQCLYLGGVARLDFLDGPPSTLFSVFASERLHIHPTNIDRADTLYDDHVGKTTEIFTIPLGGPARMAKLPPLIGKKFQTIGHSMMYSSCDITLSCAGWVAVTAPTGKLVEVMGWSLGGVGLGQRDSLLPTAVQQRGRRKKAQGRRQEFFGKGRPRAKIRVAQPKPGTHK